MLRSLQMLLHAVPQKYISTTAKSYFNSPLNKKSFQNVQNCIYFLTINFPFLLADVSPMEYSKESIPTSIRWAGIVMIQADKDFLRRPRRTYRNFVRLWISSGVSLQQMSSPHNKEPRLWIPIRKIFFRFFYWEKKKYKRSHLWFFYTLRKISCNVFKKYYEYNSYP